MVHAELDDISRPQSSQRSPSHRLSQRSSHQSKESKGGAVSHKGSRGRPASPPPLRQRELAGSDCGSNSDDDVSETRCGGVGGRGGGSGGGGIDGDPGKNATDEALKHIGGDSSGSDGVGRDGDGCGGMPGLDSPLRRRRKKKKVAPAPAERGGGGGGGGSGGGDGTGNGRGCGAAGRKTTGSAGASVTANSSSSAGNSKAEQDKHKVSSDDPTPYDFVFFGPAGFVMVVRAGSFFLRAKLYRRLAPLIIGWSQVQQLRAPF